MCAKVWLPSNTFLVLESWLLPSGRSMMSRKMLRLVDSSQPAQSGDHECVATTHPWIISWLHFPTRGEEQCGSKLERHACQAIESDVEQDKLPLKPYKGSNNTEKDKASVIIVKELMTSEHNTLLNLSHVQHFLFFSITFIWRNDINSELHNAKLWHPFWLPSPVWHLHPSREFLEGIATH